MRIKGDKMKIKNDYLLKLIKQEVSEILSEQAAGPGQLGQTISDERREIEEDAVTRAKNALTAGDMMAALEAVIEAVRKLSPESSESEDPSYGKQLPPPGHPAYESDPP